MPEFRNINAALLTTNYQPMDHNLILLSDVNPLLPGAVLVSILRDPQTKQTLHYDNDSLEAFNRVSCSDTVDNFCSHAYIAPKEAGLLKSLIQSFEDTWINSRKSLNIRAKGFGYNAKDADIIFRTALALNLFHHVLQVTAPPQLTYVKLEAKDVDVIELMKGGAMRFIGGIWCKMVPRNQGIVKAYGTKQLWRAGFQDSAEECFHGIDDGVQIIEDDGVASFRGLIEDGDFADELIESYDLLEEDVNNGIDDQFKKVGIGCDLLGLSPLCLAFIHNMLTEAAWAYARIDGSVSHSETRFVENIIGRIGNSLAEYRSERETQSSSVQEEDFETVLNELDSMIGLASVKARVREAANLARVQQMRAAQGMPMVKSSLHMVYFGNPGTGKTTVARLMGRIYCSLGILRKGHLVECDRSKLVAEYVGQTAIKTNEIIDSALDGILFIDEAYTLSGKGEKDYGKEAVDTLLKRMEDERGRLIVIVAGYTEEMNQFIASNPGLQSRFTNYILFPDYSASELSRIFSSMARQNGLVTSSEFKKTLLLHYSLLLEDKPMHFGNARDVRNMFETTITRQANRIAQRGDFSGAALSAISHLDFASELIETPKTNRLSQEGIDWVCICPECKEVYSWDPESELINAECHKCGHIFNVEFGQLNNEN